jgi:hypothetical protein
MSSNDMRVICCSAIQMDTPGATEQFVGRARKRAVAGDRVERN